MVGKLNFGIIPIWGCNFNRGHWAHRSRRDFIWHGVDISVFPFRSDSDCIGDD